ncbi:MAG TPA: hypothetical protein VGF89_09330 [Steroidobacteraceae bacterium]|jgi:hypothetical protein
MRRRALLIGAVSVASVAALGLWLCARRPSVPRIEIRGGDAGGIPRVLPSEAHLDGTALQDAGNDAAASGLQALVVVRGDYIVFERYGHGFSADTPIDSGGFARTLLALAAGIASHDDRVLMPDTTGFDPSALRQAIEAGTHQGYAEYLSIRLWRPLNAANAWIEVPAVGAAAPADCCFHARIVDWLRVAMLLLADGRFEGKAIVPAGWVQHMRQPVSASGADGFGIELPPAAHGAEAFADRDVLFMRGPARWRIWVMPRLRLALLFGSAGDSVHWDETRLANRVIRALSEPAAAGTEGSKLQQLVPGH